MDLHLQGRRAIVVGATRGIGRAIADLLTDEGCDIGICARNADQVAAVTAELGAKGIRAVGSAVDAANGEALTAFVDATAEQLGGLDIYVSNASGAFGGGNDED